MMTANPAMIHKAMGLPLRGKGKVSMADLMTPKSGKRLGPKVAAKKPTTSTRASDSDSDYA